MSEACRYFLFLITVFCTNTIQVITGFAGAMLAMPPSIRLIGFEPAKAILNVITMASCVCVVAKHWKSINFRELLKILLLMGIGLIAGIKLLDYFTSELLLKFYGVLIIAIAIKKLFIKKEIHMPYFCLCGCLLAAGLIHGMFLSGGSFLVVYAVAALPDKEEFRSTVSAVWVVLNTYLLTEHYRAGYFEPYVWKLLIVALIPFGLAVWAGNKLASRISTEKFLLITYLLLLVSGLSVLL